MTDPPEARCPHCSEELTKPPKRKARCPHCKEDIYVRTTQELFPTHWLTERQARAADWLKTLENFGIGIKTYREKEEGLREASGSAPDPLDVIWEMLQVLIERESSSQRGAFHMAARFLDEEGRDFRPMLKRAYAADLENYRDSHFIEGVTIQAEHCCEECFPHHDREIPIRDALQNPPLPIPSCIRKQKGDPGFCRCHFAPKYSKDLSEGITVQVTPKSTEQAGTKGCLLLLLVVLGSFLVGVVLV